ncbi:DUF4811 domain-containing protein [Lentilactobacillus parakefiri]|uniref:DUF4811 domain-containing protein n=1 Tax=Lentilactobacillus parakefiri TaxID=152332 RepID=A0A269YPS4_9LACO|nr:DUF4811 domain-containing protein [Lentilactobacillus parakefiri]PAK87241.1 hypothetical protein B8W98_01855 [Lentilactobacillus parakefiri]
MIVYMLIIFTILMFVSWLFINNSALRWTIGTITTGLLLMLSVALSANLSMHWGMEKKTTIDTSKNIETAGNIKSPVSTLIVKQIGTKSNNYVMIYRPTKTSLKPMSHFVPDKKDIVSSAKKKATYQVDNVRSTKLMTKKTEWVFKSPRYKWLLSFDHNDHQLIKQRTVLYLPKRLWVVMSVNQAQKLDRWQKSTGAKKQKMLQKQMRLAIKQKVGIYKRAHPKADSNALMRYTDQLKTEMTMRALKTALKTVS